MGEPKLKFGILFVDFKVLFADSEVLFADFKVLFADATFLVTSQKNVLSIRSFPTCIYTVKSF